MTDTSEQVAEALAHNTRETTVGIRMTQTERAKLDRARGKLGLSDWCRQVLLAAAEGEPARAPSADAAWFRKLHDMIVRLGVRQKSRDVWEEELLLAVYEVREFLHLIAPLDNLAVNKLQARTQARQENWRFEKSLERVPSANPDPVDHDTSLKELQTAVFSLKSEIAHRFTSRRRHRRPLAEKIKAFCRLGRW